MRQEDEPIAQPESQGMPGKENPELVDEVYIPDYVMLGFGAPDATRTEG
jgi:hypothetical protein